MISTNSQPPTTHLGDVIIAGKTENGEHIQKWVSNENSLWRMFEIELQGGTVFAVIPVTTRRQS